MVYGFFKASQKHLKGKKRDISSSVSRSDSHLDFVLGPFSSLLPSSAWSRCAAVLLRAVLLGVFLFSFPGCVSVISVLSARLSRRLLQRISQTVGAAGREIQRGGDLRKPRRGNL